MCTFCWEGTGYRVQAVLSRCGCYSTTVEYYNSTVLLSYHTSVLSYYINTTVLLLCTHNTTPAKPAAGLAFLSPTSVQTLLHAGIFNAYQRYTSTTTVTLTLIYGKVHKDADVEQMQRPLWELFTMILCSNTFCRRQCPLCSVVRCRRLQALLVGGRCSLSACADTMFGCYSTT